MSEVFDQTTMMAFLGWLRSPIGRVAFTEVEKLPLSSRTRTLIIYDLFELYNRTDEPFVLSDAIRTIAERHAA